MNAYLHAVNNAIELAQGMSLLTVAAYLAMRWTWLRESPQTKPGRIAGRPELSALIADGAAGRYFRMNIDGISLDSLNTLSYLRSNHPGVR
ncbi:hypothetical protein [Methylomicrobium lacus]|uniref:hypothetical protein n=1 Tax=Methylomicrobium lacus TaxID=136992 RepID=UPI0035A923AB